MKGVGKKGVAIFCDPLFVLPFIFSVLKKSPALPHFIRINNINTQLLQT